MKYFIVLCFFSLFSSALAARTKPTGIGFIAGAPTGLSLQLNATQSHPINLGIAYEFSHWTQIWGDYTFHYPNFIDSVFHGKSGVDSYIGIGGAFLIVSKGYLNGSVGVLVRVPFGLEYDLKDAPIGFMLELAPAILIVPSTSFHFQGGIGARFYF